VNILITIDFDTSVLEQQMKDLLSEFPEGVPGEFVSDIKSLASDIVLGKPLAATGADQIVKHVYTPRFGARFENFLAAIRANKGGPHA